MKQTINIASIAEKNGWFNIKTVEGQEVSVNAESNPVSTAKLKTQPITIELNLVEKNGKNFGWDVKDNPKPQGAFAKLTPEQLKAKQDREDSTQRMIVAQNSISNASNFYAQRQNGDILSILKMAEDMYNWVISKSK